MDTRTQDALDSMHANLTAAIEAETTAERYAIAIEQAVAHGDLDTHIDHLASLALHYALMAGTLRNIARLASAELARTGYGMANARVNVWQRAYESVAV